MALAARRQQKSGAAVPTDCRRRRHGAAGTRLLIVCVSLQRIEPTNRKSFLVQDMSNILIWLGQFSALSLQALPRSRVHLEGVHRASCAQKCVQTT